jgi:tRNA threonylcarbamoyladenosine biosynthesis protein TsaE
MRFRSNAFFTFSESKLMNFILNEERQTEELGAKLQAVVCPGSVIYLQGNLGAGKTTLVRGFLRAAGWEDAVKSPTYTLVEPYQLGNSDYFHFDLYRLKNEEELSFIGIRDYFYSGSICIIEWAERAPSFLAPADIVVILNYKDNGRDASIEAKTKLGKACLKLLEEEKDA